MPNVKSAEKRVRQAPKRAARNRAVRSAFRTSLKKSGAALDSGDVEKAAAQVQETLRAIGNTERKGIIHKNKAARHASRLAKRLKVLKTKDPGASS